MRIDHIVHQFPPEARGGLEGYVLDLARAQASAGDDVAVVSGSLEPRPEFSVEVSEFEGLAVTRLHRGDLYFDAWDKGAHPSVEAELRRRWTVRRPDLIHIHHWIRLTENLVEIARDLGIPTVVTLHDFAPSCPRAFRMYAADGRPCFRETGPESCSGCAHRWPWLGDEDMADALTWFRRNARAELSGAGARICASSAVAETIARGLSLETESIEVIPLGYEPRFYGRAPRPAGGDPLRVAYWGSVTERKGLLVLAKALKHLTEEGIPVSLDLFGRIDDEGLGESIRTELDGIEARLHGAYEYEELKQTPMDVAVFPSICLETYGLVVDEAQELGLPIVVPQEGAMAERIGAGGMTFPLGDDAGLADQLRTLGTDRSRLAELRGGVAGPGQPFKHHLSSIRSVYDRVIAAGVGEGVLDPFTPAERSRQAFERAELMFRRLLGQ